MTSFQMFHTTIKPVKDGPNHYVFKVKGLYAYDADDPVGPKRFRCQAYTEADALNWFTSNIAGRRASIMGGRVYYL